MISLDEVVDWLHVGGGPRYLHLKNDTCLTLYHDGNGRALARLREKLLEVGACYSTSN